MDNEIYPLTVIKDRYRGTYSGGKYLAFNLDFNEIPEDVIGSDVPCRQFFYETDLIYGRGNTPDEAIWDLATQRLRAKVCEGGSYCPLPKCLEKEGSDVSRKNQ